MSDVLKDFEANLRQQLSREGRESVSEDRVTLLKIRQLVAEYQLLETERQRDLAELVEVGEGEGSPAHASQVADNDAEAAGNLRDLFADLVDLLP